jgi:hypothetical protein
MFNIKVTADAPIRFAAIGISGIRRATGANRCWASAAILHGQVEWIDVLLNYM